MSNSENINNQTASQENELAPTARFSGLETETFSGYARLLQNIKHRVRVSQGRAIYAANEELLRLYCDIGEMLDSNQNSDGWGKKTLQRLSIDLKNEYPEIKGFTVRNMQYMVQFYKEYNQSLTQIKENEITKLQFRNSSHSILHYLSNI